MQAIVAEQEVPAPVDDVLAYLPVSTIVDCRRGQTIYGPEQPSVSIYFAIAGKVKLSRISEDGGEVLLEIIRTGEIFGESAFVAGARAAERATAIENARLMTWPVSAVEDLVTKRPRLAVSLLQISAQRTNDLARRIESLSVDKVETRLARSLLRFCARLGAPEKDGSVRMMPMTHELLSRHIGTSREVVTMHMNQFRSQGYLRYSRQAIVIHRCALAEWTAKPARIKSLAAAGAE